MKFICGHDGQEPRNMGRGLRRQARLAEFFNRKCLACRMAAEDAFEASLTRPRAAEHSAMVREKIANSYR